MMRLTLQEFIYLLQVLHALYPSEKKFLIEFGPYVITNQLHISYKDGNRAFYD